jgi:predicted nucleic acid-binding protein
VSTQILIDTCGWIDFLRSRSSALGDKVAQAIADDKALLCSVTLTELLQGVKTPKEKQQLDFLFASVKCLPVEDADWLTAGNQLQALRARGLTVPLTDALIAAVAKRNGVAVLTVDVHFEQLSIELA